MTEPLLVLRADATTKMGTGHVHRSLALAEAWMESGGRAVLVSAELAGPLRERWLRAGALTHDARGRPGSDEDLHASLGLCRELGAHAFAVDGYHFPSAWQGAARAAGLRSLVVDDLGTNGPYVADIVVNVSPSAAERDYAGAGASAKLLLGPSYALLRREFIDHGTTTPRRDAHRILVTLGGADAENVTSTVLDALELIETPLEVTVLAGPMNPHAAALAKRQSRHGLKILQAPNDLPRLFATSDLAVAAGGGTAWELAFLGVPMVLVGIAADQRENREWLAKMGAAVDAGEAPNVTPKQLAAACLGVLRDDKLRDGLSAAARRIVDGQGAARVVQALRGEALRVRLATANDARMLFDWANDPEVRKNSFSSRPIAWDEHVAWLASKLASSTTRFYVALDANDRPVGQIRFEISGGQAEVHVALAAAARGQGLGGEIIRIGTRRALHDTGADAVHAFVKSENDRSKRAFERAGYRVLELAPDSHGHPAFHLIAQNFR